SFKCVWYKTHDWAECLDIFHASERISDCFLMRYLTVGRRSRYWRCRRIWATTESGCVMRSDYGKGRRLKQTGACWRLRQAEKMTVLCAALYCDQWKLCQNNP
ncbi:MAG: hypothetical protein LBU65_13665, partial [Planctomycetaceae bacterium]|nr:hypothetical protein [Planctomycetaceae bacterium]